MYNFLNSWNLFIFKRRLNIFDVLAIFMVNYLMAYHSMWYVLLLIFTILFSVFMENKLGFNYGANHGTDEMV